MLGLKLNHVSKWGPCCRIYASSHHWFMSKSQLICVLTYFSVYTHGSVMDGKQNNFRWDSRARFLNSKRYVHKKTLNRAKLSTSMKLSTMLGHRTGTNFTYGAMQKSWYLYCGGHIWSAITAFVFILFGHICKTNWLMITNLVSYAMFSGSRIPMEPFKIPQDHCYSGIMHGYHEKTLYLTHRYLREFQRHSSCTVSNMDIYIQ